jgi:hypothetical protein
MWMMWMYHCMAIGESEKIRPDHPLKDLAGQMCFPAWGLLSLCSNLRVRSEETLLELQKELSLSHSNLVVMNEVFR